MKWVWVVIPLVLMSTIPIVSAQYMANVDPDNPCFRPINPIGGCTMAEILENLYGDTKQYPPPLKQLRDGIDPQNIKCNEGKVLFFKYLDMSPVCIFDSSIKKLVFDEHVFFGWSIKDNLVDWSYVQNKMNELEFENLTYISVSNLDKVSSPTPTPIIAFTQEFKSNSNSDVLFYYDFFFNKSEKIMPDPFIKSSYSFPFHEPRRQDYNRLNDSGYGVFFNCKDTSQLTGIGNPEIHVFYDIDKLTLTGYAKSKSMLSNNVTNSNQNTYQFEFGSLYPTQFQSDYTLLIQDISETQCVTDNVLVSSAFPIRYYYTVSFEIKNE